jgi:hypothetical protein
MPLAGVWAKVVDLAVGVTETEDQGWLRQIADYSDHDASAWFTR